MDNTMSEDHTDYRILGINEIIIPGDEYQSWITPGGPPGSPPGTYPPPILVWGEVCSSVGWTVGESLETFPDVTIAFRRKIGVEITAEEANKIRESHLGKDGHGAAKYLAWRKRYYGR
jgi:hypothetical protein